MNTNPFKYGGVVSDPYFIDRVEETKQLTGFLAASQNIILYSPRRYGKTSLMMKVATELKKQGIHVIYFDLFLANSRERFLELYYQSILKSVPSWEKIIRKVSGLLKASRPVVIMDQSGLPSVTLDFDRRLHSQYFAEVVDLPEKLAGKERWVVIFDEFQEISRLNGLDFEKELRAVIQHHKNVNYVMMGSKKHLLLGMVTRRDRAFYNFGKLVNLEKIREAEWIRSISAKMQGSGIRFGEEKITDLITIAENIPYYVQYLASEVWELATGSHVDGDMLDLAVTRLINNQADYYITLWSNLSVQQQNTLRALATENSKVFSKDFIDRHRLGTPSGVQSAINVLLNDGILDFHNDEYIFEDPFFRQWLKA
jgi:uncharacterized protein